jgi:exodeoxyribonuclease VII large subunit
MLQVNPQARPAPASRPGLGADNPITVEQTVRRVSAILREHTVPVWVQGEIGNWKRSGGHGYFTLKDAAAQLACFMAKRDVERLPLEPESGMKVVLRAELGIYLARRAFQATVSQPQLGDEGGLWKLAFERLKKQLDREGLLDARRKRPLPRLPRTIGIVTSETGAALQDMLNVLRRRAPWVRIVLSPTRVQGDGASAEIAAALDRLYRSACADVIIVGRGGGSLEDLWAFNEEPLARAVAAAPVPIVSAVGHEVDFSICDLVADVRAPTPSAAAELVVPDTQEILRFLDEVPKRLAASLGRLGQRKEERIGAGWERMQRAVQMRAGRSEQELRRVVGQLEALSPLASLARGYAVLSDASGKVVRGIDAVAAGDAVRVRLTDGTLAARVESAHPLATTLEQAQGYVQPE